jgi:hypothetical protein
MKKPLEIVKHPLHLVTFAMPTDMTVYAVRYSASETRRIAQKRDSGGARIPRVPTGVPRPAALASERTPCSLGLSATSQQYFSLRTN